MTMTTEHPRPPLARRGLFLAVAALVVAADVSTKHTAATVWADQPVILFDGWVRLTESRNPGAAFGMGTSLTPVLTLLAAAVVIGVLAYSGRYRTRRAALVMGLVLGGAAGNLIDRLFRTPGPMRGHVVDWIDVGAWPNFNLADSALVTACALVFAGSVLTHPDTNTESPDPNITSPQPRGSKRMREE
jgi:signal peptidase II